MCAVSYITTCIDYLHSVITPLEDLQFWCLKLPNCICIKCFYTRSPSYGFVSAENLGTDQLFMRCQSFYLILLLLCILESWCSVVMSYLSRIMKYQKINLSERGNCEILILWKKFHVECDTNVNKMLVKVTWNVFN